MSSIHTRNNTTVLQCSLTLPTKRVATSLHTKDKAVATRRANALQALVTTLGEKEQARQNKLLYLVEEIFHSFEIPVPWDQGKIAVPTSAVVEAYLARRSTRVVQSTLSFLQSTLTAFCVAVKDKPIDQVQGADVQAWYDGLLKTVAISTANHRYQAVRAVFAFAVRMGIVRLNPVLGVEQEENEESIKEPMPDESFQKLARFLDDGGHYEWLRLIFISRYTGLRLMDAVSLHWENITGGCVVCVTNKTGREVAVPILEELKPALVNHMGFMPCDYLMPNLASMDAQTLSRAFAEWMDAAGVDAKIVTTANGRTQRAITFHSLRAAFCTDLARRGVPEDLRMLLAGHTTPLVHRGYVRQDPADLVRRLKEYV